MIAQGLFQFQFQLDTSFIPIILKTELELISNQTEQLNNTAKLVTAEQKAE